MELKNAIKWAISELGQEVILDKNFVNILNDAHGFTELPAARLILKNMIEEGLLSEIYQGSFALPRINQTCTLFNIRYGYDTTIVRSVINCLIESINENNQPIMISDNLDFQQIETVDDIEGVSEMCIDMDDEDDFETEDNNDIIDGLYNLIDMIDQVCSTEVSENDLRNAWIDNYGVKYSSDRSRLLRASKHLVNYSVNPGTSVICNNAFLFRESLQKINLPNSLEAIGESAFGHCILLESIILPRYLKFIGESAFAGCGSLKSIIIPENVTYIGDSAFSCCFNLEYVTLPKKLMILGNEAFSCCDLKEVSLPASLTEISKDAFDLNLQLNKIYIPKGTRSHFEEMLSDEYHAFLIEI